jgi:threonine aldolase
MHSFASDNYAGVHPDVLAAIGAVNAGHQRSYGYDPVTAEAEELFRAHFGRHAEAYFVANGTAANVLSLQAVLRPYQAVICAESAHINTDECGAPERYLGCKLIDLPTPDGKLTVDLLDAQVSGRADEHQVQPAAIAITQSTELGTRWPRYGRSPTGRTPAEWRCMSMARGWPTRRPGSASGWARRAPAAVWTCSRSAARRTG